MPLGFSSALGPNALSKIWSAFILLHALHGTVLGCGKISQSQIVPSFKDPRVKWSHSKY